MMPLLAVLAIQAPDTAAYTPARCPPCAEWNEPAPPARLFGNTWYVGTRGLTALLITSDSGHVLLDGGLPESAPHIMRSIRALGFRVEDVRVIGNSHAHHDHAGGLAALQRVSGAEVVALPRAVPVLRSGRRAGDDPQDTMLRDFPPVRRVRLLADGGVITLGALRVTAHATEGHAPGGTTWTWQACEGDRCLQFVYGDSQSALAAPGTAFPAGTREHFERGFRLLGGLRCDILVTPHPGASNLFGRMTGGSLIDGEACRRYASSARERLPAVIRP